MNERKMEKMKTWREYRDNMDEMEKFMEMSWGTPKGLAVLVISFAILLLSVGGFLWLLHMADIIK